MDGPQVASEIRVIMAQENLDMPYIICCTAYAEAHFKRAALSAGMDGFLTKPVSSEELKEICSLVLTD